MTESELQERIRREVQWRFPLELRTCDVCEPKPDDRLATLCEDHLADLLGIELTPASGACPHGVHRCAVCAPHVVDDRLPFRGVKPNTKVAPRDVDPAVERALRNGEIGVLVGTDLRRYDPELRTVVVEHHAGAGDRQSIHVIDSRTEVLR